MAESSCTTWKTILSKSLPRKCDRNCFEPLNGSCADHKIVDVLGLHKNIEDPHVVFQEAVAMVGQDGPVRRQVYTNDLCSECYENSEKPGKFCDAQNAIHRNICSAECRPLSTNLLFKEVCNYVLTF